MNDGVCGAARGCQGRQEAAKGCKPPHGAVTGLCAAVRGCACVAWWCACVECVWKGKGI